MTRAEAKALTLSKSNNLFGLVHWCITPPIGQSWATHKLSALDAIELASGMLRSMGGTGRYSDYRLVVGKKWVDIVSMLPDFDATNMPLHHGRLKGILVEFDKLIPDDEALLLEGKCGVKLRTCVASYDVEA